MRVLRLPKTPAAAILVLGIFSPWLSNQRVGVLAQSTLEISQDGTCGEGKVTCVGSTWGQCCSAHGFCGHTDDYCGAGCNPEFGSCSSAGSISLGCGISMSLPPSPTCHTTVTVTGTQWETDTETDTVTSIHTGTTTREETRIVYLTQTVYWTSAVYSTVTVTTQRDTTTIRASAAPSPTIPGASTKCENPQRARE